MELLTTDIWSLDPDIVATASEFCVACLLAQPESPSACLFWYNTNVDGYGNGYYPSTDVLDYDRCWKPTTKLSNLK